MPIRPMAVTSHTPYRHVITWPTHVPSHKCTKCTAT